MAVQFTVAPTHHRPLQQSHTLQANMPHIQYAYLHFTNLLMLIHHIIMTYKKRRKNTAAFSHLSWRMRVCLCVSVYWLHGSKYILHAFSSIPNGKSCNKLKLVRSDTILVRIHLHLCVVWFKFISHALTTCVDTHTHMTSACMVRPMLRAAFFMTHRQQDEVERMSTRRQDNLERA